MLDPLTTATSCISLINGITSLTLHIAVFVNDVRGARKDMDLISRELTSLSLCLGALRTDCQSHQIEYAEASRKGIEQALLNIDVLTHQVKDLLQKLSSGRLGRRVQWTVQSRDTVDRLRSSLETQKTAIEIALQCGSIQILCAIQKQVEGQNLDYIKDDTGAIRGDTAALRKDVVKIKDLIRKEVDALRADIASLQNGKALSTELQQFLVESQSYSTAVTNPFATPEPSEAGLVESMADDLSRSSLTLTNDLSYKLIDLADNYEDTNAWSSQLEDRCTRCGRYDAPMAINTSPRAVLSFSGVSTLAMIPKERPGFHIIMRYGGLTANHTFGLDAEFRTVMEWAFNKLDSASKDERIWLHEVKNFLDVRFNRNGSPFLFYPSEKLSQLATMYGIESTLELDIPGVYAQARPRSPAALMIEPEKIKFPRPYTSEQIQTLTLTNTNNAPVAWCSKTTAPKSYCVRPHGGVLYPGDSVEVLIVLVAMREEPSFDAVCKDKKLFQAVYLEPGDFHHNWRKLIDMPGRERWERKLRVEFSSPLPPE